MKADNSTPSLTSPKNSRRACLCKGKNTYSRKCCDGSLWAQGIGSINSNTDRLFTTRKRRLNFTRG